MKIVNCKIENSQAGYAAITSVIIAVAVSLIVLGSLATFSLKEVSVNRAFQKSVESRFVAESGIEDFLYRVVSGKQTASSETLGTGLATTTITLTASGTQKIIRSEGRRDVFGQNVSVVVDTAAPGASFHYGVQVDAGGISMNNGAKVIGNVFSNGSISGGEVTGTATVAGGSGNTISNSTIDVSARAPEFNNVTVAGSPCPNAGCVVASDTPQMMPISDSVIQDWRDDAVAGGTCGPPTCDSSGNLDLDNGTTLSLGPIKIPGKMTLHNNVVLTVTGTIWVVGKTDISNNSIVKLGSGYGTNSGIILTDDDAEAHNNVIFQGSGQAGSYIMLVSAKTDHSHDVVDVDNGSTGVIYYAPHGRIHFHNNAAAKEVTAYGMDLDNNSTVTYESGLADVHFSSGPSGGYTIRFWKEVE